MKEITKASQILDNRYIQRVNFILVQVSKHKIGFQNPKFVWLDASSNRNKENVRGNIVKCGVITKIPKTIKNDM